MKKTMANTQQLTEADRFFIETKNKENMSVEDMAKAVNKPVEIVREFVSKIVVKKEKSLFEKNLGGSQGKRKGTIVGTESASQVGDVVVKAGKVGAMKYKDAIAKCREDD